MPDPCMLLLLAPCLNPQHAMTHMVTQLPILLYVQYCSVMLYYIKLPVLMQ